MNTIQKFQELLKNLFQFETSDLDFGIYRILNYKRDQIERFIQKDLVERIESAFSKHKDERLTNVSQRFEEAKEKIIQSLGKDAFTPTGELKEEFKNTPLGRDYLLIKTQKDEVDTIDEIKLQLFNDLYNFFSRFYEEGDFVPQYRYSIKGHKYAIPYNGEEVKLYWANQDQYYIKTGLLFRDYTFTINSPSSKGCQAKPDGVVRIIFRIVSAKEEVASKKATKQRFLILDDKNPVYSPSQKGCQAKPDGVVHWKDLPYNPKLKEKAKELRKAGNLSEVLFWQKVKNKQFLGLDFDRQKIIGNYIVDFFCKNLGIVVEIDGETHNFKGDYDEERDKYLKSLGLEVLHIQDKDIKKNLDRVMEWLKQEIENTPSFGHPSEEGNTPSANADTPLKEENALIIHFQYRELTEKEVRSYQVEGGSNTSKQERINQETYEDILKKINDSPTKAILTKEYKNEKPLLLYQISRFTAKNTKDYFIHKNLKKFLSEQLDYFIKSEVLSIETLEKERFLDKHITRAKVVREIGEDIIDFLSQIEDFQKRLWEKKKFVLKTEYVITTDRVPEEFYGEIWNNKEQKKEWKELGFEIEDLRLEDLKSRKLPIDTRYFNQDFKEKLLEKLTQDADLDDLLDGLLIKSENWQALNLLLGKYKGKIKTVYIDPPYNTGSDEFLYRDRYQHSSWLSMIENRLWLTKKLMREDGVIFISIANSANYYKESYKLGLLLENLFDKRFSDLIWKRRSASGSYVISDITEIHEYILAWGMQNSGIFTNILSSKKLKDYVNKDERGVFKWHDLVIHQYTKEQRPNLFYGVVYNFKENRLDFTKNPEEINPSREVVIYPSEDGKSVFTMTKKSMEEVYDRGVIGIIRTKKKYKIMIKKYLYDTGGMIIGDPLKSIIDDNEMPYKIGGTAEATKELRNLLGITFDTAKPSNLIKLLIHVSSRKNDLILDFFAGSGTTAHAVMKLNKEDGGRRKYILVEMADYFDTVLIPRLKKICYSFNWKDGKPQDTDGISQFFKYQILEQYEDTLDNIELNPNETAQSLFKDEYLLKYFLDYETRENPSLLNVEQLNSPFSYKLKVNLEEVGKPQEVVVDIPETFNYLLGLKVKKIKGRNTPSADADTPLKEGNTPSFGHPSEEGKKRKYLFILGEKEGKEIAIVWRDYDDKWSDEDFKKDKEYIIKELTPWTPDIVYVNGQSVLTPKLGGYTVEIRYIEPEFKRLMEG